VTVERIVTEHYRHGALEEALLEGLAAAGKDLDNLTADDLAPADEFHIGGRQATVDLAADFNPATGTHILDIGSGLGGPARYFAQAYHCRVTGIDLNEEFVAVATSLTRRVGLSTQVDYRQASALALPFADATFDGAYMENVGMNIADKVKLFNEVHRVLKPYGIFAMFDVMRINEGDFRFPVPWASGAEGNFIETPATYRALLSAEGFEIIKERDRRQFAIDFFAAEKARLAKSGRPALGLHIVNGPAAREKFFNMLAMLESGVISVVEMICRRVERNPHAGYV
jgi:ubiquinone/menaquinone biosynthesis C-methylase UbiE